MDERNWYSVGSNNILLRLSDSRKDREDRKDAFDIVALLGYQEESGESAEAGRRV